MRVKSGIKPHPNLDLGGVIYQYFVTGEVYGTEAGIETSRC